MSILRVISCCFALVVFLTARNGAVAALSPVEQRIAAWAAGQKESFARDLEEALRIDSATENVAGVRRFGEWHAAQLRELGFDVRLVEQREAMKRGPHLVAERQGGHGQRLLLIGHLDTVLPAWEVRREGDTLHGSGANDMKGGNLVVIYALRALQAAGALDGTRVNVVFTGDEESPGHPIDESRALLRELAGRSDLALGFETSIAGTATVARRGIISWELEVQGATGHSSGLWNRAMGSGAVYEMSRILTGFHEALREMDGVTCNPGVILGGTQAEWAQFGGTASGKTNVVAQRALARGDLRYLSAAQVRQAQEAMQAIVRQNLPRTSAELRFAADGFPAMEAAAENHALLARLDEVSRDLGFGSVTAYDPKARGAGDIAFVSPPLPGLDGLGVQGRRAHAPGETMELANVTELIARTAVLIHRLTR